MNVAEWIEKMQCNPFGRHDGQWKSVDGSLAEPFESDQVAEVVAFQTDGGGWDGSEASIIKLVDGRYAAWEVWWGPTGSGFCCDAYGGDSEIFFGATQESVVRYLSETVRERLGVR